MVSSSPLRTPVTHSIVTSSVMSAAGGWSPSTPQYRGEPRIPVDTTPGAAADASNVRRDEVSPGKCSCSVEATECVNSSVARFARQFLSKFPRPVGHITAAVQPSKKKIARGTYTKTF